MIAQLPDSPWRRGLERLFPSTESSAETASADLEWPRSRQVASVAALLILCAVYTLGAVVAFPFFDDGWAWLMLRERGREGIQASMSDRPFVGWLWGTLAIRGSLLWGASLVAQAVLWPAMGVVSARLWSRLFPQLKRYAWLAACVAVAPFVTKVQMVTLNMALQALISVVPAYLALLLAWRFVDSGTRRGRAALAASPAILTFAILLNEYALPVVIVGCTLLVFEWWQATDVSTRSRILLTLAVLLVTAAVAYSVYLVLADPGARSDVRPAHILKLKNQPSWFPSILLLSLWRGLIGGFVEHFQSLPALITANPWALIVGLLVSGLLVWGFLSKRDPETAGDGYTWLALLAALVAGLAPVVAMGRNPWNPEIGLNSRFGIPVLPVLAALTVRTAIGLTHRRWRAITVFLVSFTAALVAADEVRAAIKERRQMSRLGAALQERVVGTKGHTIAVIPVQARAMGAPLPWELVARLGYEWPVKQTRKLWAYRTGGGPSFGNYEDRAEQILGPRTRCRHKPNRWINENIRFLKRRGPVEQVLWVTFRPDDSVKVEPYCKKRPQARRSGK